MRMKDQQLRDRASLAEQAAEWFVVNRGTPGSAESEEFLQWLKTSPLNIQEYLGVTQVAQDLKACAPEDSSWIDDLVERARRESDPVVRALPARLTRTQEPQKPRWKLLAVAAAIVATVGVSLLTWRHATIPAPLTAAELHLQTRHGMQITQRLRDNSVLHLNTDSDVLVRYDAKGRWVTIKHGQVTFDVAHDPQHPFHVFAGVAEVTARGTVFDVRLEDSSTVVTVVEGRVVVEPTTSDQAQPTSNREGSPSARAGSHLRTPVEVAANQQLRVSATDWQETASPVDARHATAWLRHQIAFENEPLADVAAEFNRYNAARIEIESAQLRTLRISGVFAENDPESFVVFLRSLNGVQVDVTPTRIRVYSLPHPVPKHQ